MATVQGSALPAHLCVQVPQALQSLLALVLVGRTGQLEFRESSAQEVALELNLDKWLPTVVLNEQRCCRMRVLGF